MFGVWLVAHTAGIAEQQGGASEWPTETLGEDTSDLIGQREE